MLAWWENLPILSWLLLRGRCRACRSWISLRYPAIELIIGVLWALCWAKLSEPIFADPQGEVPHLVLRVLIEIAAAALLCWLLVALSALDAEYFWLPDWLTLPGIALGFVFTVFQSWMGSPPGLPANLLHAAWKSLLAILAPGGVILLIRLVYWLVRRQEGMGLGDAKLMAMLGAWLGLRGSLETFVLAIFLAAAAALLWLPVLAFRRTTTGWSTMPLPFGTFLCAAALMEVFYPHWLWMGLNLDLLAG